MQAETLVETDENTDKPAVFRSFFEEAEEVQKLIALLPTTCEQKELPRLNTLCLDIAKIFDKYQEQCQLLDPHLEQIVNSLMNKVRIVTLENVELQCVPVRHSLFKLLYTLTKVRGFATIIKQFPHEIADLEPLFLLYTKIHDSEWETRYILLLWLSLIVINPFDLTVVDSAIEGIPLCDRMVTVGKKALPTSSKVKDGSAIFIARLLTRPDMASKHLSEYLQWAADTIEHSNDQFMKAGVLMSLVQIFQYGKREELLDKIPFIFKVALSDPKNATTVLRKFNIKLVQRIGLTYLKPRVVSWRYQKSRISLLNNLKGQHMEKRGDMQMEEDIDIPQEIEEIIEKLLNGLRDKDTIVRWSAAKGIGRITMRLNKDLGDDIVKSILELFSESETDGAWHGGCLSLAELARRGLLLPERLKDVIPVVIQALQYDVQRGAHSIGAHVRDAACYVCWGFARAYSADIMKQYVHSLASTLLKTAVFDREVNCRRAAAAAFQENVGRQGNFPHGIEILTRADYFTLCNRNTAYLEISPFIAQFETYGTALIDELVDSKTIHWDKSLRELASKTLHNLTAANPIHVLDVVLPKLLERTVDEDLCVRHGSILAAAEAIFAISKTTSIIPEKMQNQLWLTVPTIEAKRLYRGKGGEMMREAVCRFIECIALSNLEAPNVLEYESAVGSRMIKKKTVIRFLETLDENLKHPNEGIIDAAVNSFKAFCATYIKSPKEASDLFIVKMVDTLKTDDNPTVRRGYVKALSVLPRNLIIDKFTDVLKVMCEKVQLEAQVESRDAEARRNAVTAVISLCEVVGVSPDGVSTENVETIFRTLILGTRDYGVDNRGDVGSWVREAAIKALHRFAIMICNSEQSDRLFTPAIAAGLVSAVLKQANERIDKVRAVAGGILQDLITRKDPVIINIPHCENLKQLVTEIAAKLLHSLMAVDWGNAEISYHNLVCCMDYPEYSYDILTAYLMSAGCLSAHVSKCSSEALVGYLQKQVNNVEKLKKIGQDCVHFMTSNLLDEKVTTILLKTFTLLISRGCFDPLQFAVDEFAVKLLDALALEVKGSNSVSKLLLAIGLYCELLKFDEPVRSAAFSGIIDYFLVSKYPKVRTSTSEQVFSFIQLYGEDLFPEQQFTELLGVIQTTPWHATTAVLKPHVQQLRKVLHLQVE